ncbi:alpha/beta fold hydrolase [Glutamicibacter sp. NPDC127525]|uniref:alpha/beta fold hydrolase n=1 Tax=unclassified Glutamicibacter TaxID=2627139 RepID=UPI0036360163
MSEISQDHCFVEKTTPYEPASRSLGIVFIHGLGGNSNVHFPLRQAVEHLYPTVALDLTGLGRSKDRSPDGFGNWIQDVKLAIEQLGDVEGVLLVGHSLGTLVARHIAAHEPRVKGLVLFAPIAGPDVSQRPAFAARASAARTDGMVRVAHDFGLGGLSHHTMTTRPVAVTLVREFLMGQDATRYAECCIAVGEAGEALPPADPSASVLLVRGIEDMVSTAEETAACEAALEPNQVQTAVLDRVAHWPTVEDPEGCIELLLSFLVDIDQTSSIHS